MMISAEQFILEILLEEKERGYKSGEKSYIFLIGSRECFTSSSSVLVYIFIDLYNLCKLVKNNRAITCT